MTAVRYDLALRLADTRPVGEDFPDMLAAPVRFDRLTELGLPDATSRELAELRRARDVLVDAVLGDVALADRVDRFNSLATSYRLVAQLDIGMELRLVSDRPGRVARVVERVVPQVTELLRTGDVERLELCAADDCAAPFVPASSGRPRSYCSPRCSGRVRLRRFRETHGPG